MSAGRRWDDLKPRLLTGGLLILIGVVDIWLGGITFTITVALVIGLIIWELARMISPAQTSAAIQLGVLAAICLLVERHVPNLYALPLLLVPALAGAFMLRAYPWLFAIYALGITTAGYGLTVFRDDFGVAWLFWLVIVVAMTDIAGYFAGRMIGGAKFWPAISPKKTWSGVVAGWIAAACVGAVFVMVTAAGIGLIWISAVLSFASQMGDIAQSAVKRKMGVKDSSNLLPGHGGLFDRFDAMLGASLFMVLIVLMFDLPGLRF